MESRDEAGDAKIIRSPFVQVAKKITVPDISLTNFAFQSLKMNEKVHGDKAVLIDAVSGQTILFKEIEPLSKRFAGALAKKGFQKGDVLYYVTYNAALLYVLHFGIWLCGGAIRGCYQREEKEEIGRQMRETGCRFVLCESETAPAVKWAIEHLDWTVQLLSIDGEVEGAIPVEDMVYRDDGSEYKVEVEINPKEDIVCIPSTNGSTGLPKGVLHTHYNIVAMLAGIGAPIDLERAKDTSKRILSVMGNFNIGPFISFYLSVFFGHTYISISKFDKTSFFRHIDKYKPDLLFIFPYLANWFARCPELDTHDLTCIREIISGGSVFDNATLSIIIKRLPFVKVSMLYGMTETLIVSSLSWGQYFQLETSENKVSLELKVEKLNDDEYVSCGPLLPLVEAKVLDIETGEALGRRAKGKLFVRTPYIMKDYLKDSHGKGYISGVDENGWIDTGDAGFFDDDGHLYIIDRLKSIFKYQMYQVSPAEIERVIGEHPAVLSVCVVGIPDPLTTAAARAYVVIKPGFNVTEEEIKKYVADKTVFYKHLHGGVAFVDRLPETRGGKMDRTSLLQKAINEMTSKCSAMQ